MIGDVPGVPVRLRWDAKPLEQFDLGGLLAPPRSSKVACARRSIVASLLLEGAGQGRPHYYSRRRTHYAEVAKRYSAGLYTYANVVPCVEEMAGAGLINHRKAPQGEDVPFRSEFEPHPDFLRWLVSMAPDLSALAAHEVIERRQGKIPVDYRDTERSRQERHDLIALNEALACADIKVPLSDGEWLGSLYREQTGGGFYCFNTDYRALTRIYNDRRLNLGGRNYGGFWQQMKKQHRHLLRLDGEPTAEPDYSQIHPTILYRQAGQRLTGDAYDLGPDIERSDAKRAVNILINARTERSAVGAIAKHTNRRTADAWKLLEAAKRRHLPIANTFCSGAGLRCQFLDSEMAGHVMQDALGRGRVVLPIHDSFRCRASDESHVRESMSRAFETVMREAAR